MSYDAVGDLQVFVDCLGIHISSFVTGVMMNEYYFNYRTG